MNINIFLNLRSHENCLILDPNIVSSIVNSFTNIDNKNQSKKYKNQPKKIINILKNPKIKLIKDKISNKVNLILNKLSENNIENLVIEFIENIKITNIDEYNEFIRTFYIKILSEINFSKNYLKFFSLITDTYNSIYDYNIEYLYYLIENKFKYDYENINDNNLDLLKDIDSDDKRINNLSLLNIMINLNYFNLNFKIYIENYLLEQTKYLSDIHHWFKSHEINEKQTINNYSFSGLFSCWKRNSADNSYRIVRCKL